MVLVGNPNAAPATCVAQIAIGALDAAGASILSVYYKQTPDYAVYRTSERVMVHFADDPAEAKAQSTALAQLNPVRGEVNGLIDGWRSSGDPKKIHKEKLYDRRVADSLIAALQGDLPGAMALMVSTKQDIVDERTSWARFEYLIVASVAAAVIAILGWLISADWFRQLVDLPSMAQMLGFAAALGAMGAFFSIALGIRSRTVLTDLRFRDNSADAILRLVIGAISAVLLICLVKLKAVTIGIGDSTLQGSLDGPGLYILIVAFVGGFSERMIPDLLGKIAADTAKNPAPRAPPANANLAASANNNTPAGPGAAGGQRPGDPTSDDDNCLCDSAVQPGEVTPDTELPAATGGVAAAGS